MKCALAIETSSPVLSLALRYAQNAIIEESIQGYMSHVENLIPLMEKILKKQNLQISDVDTFLLGRGPGSFTGLRVGFATVKALQKIQKRNCYGAASLDMIAEKIVLKENDRLTVCLDAHRSRMYSKRFIRKQNRWEPQTEIQLLSMEELVRTLPENSWIAGDALIRYADIFKTYSTAKHWNFLSEPEGYPRASSLFDLWDKKNSQVQKLETPEDFVPLYLRLSEAEERKNEHASA